MRLSDILSEKKTVILDMWFDAVLKSYPADTAVFIRDKKKQFTNPVGYSISLELEKILAGLIEGAETDTLMPCLEGLMKIRAVQGLKPSQALSFFFHLKEIIREHIKNIEGVSTDEIKTIELRIDSLALLSFDIFMDCREKLYELRAAETKNMTYRLLQRAKLVCEVQE